MTKDEAMVLLYDYCCWKNLNKIKQLFNMYPDYIDLTEDDGKAFGLAVSFKSTDLLNSLLDFYKETKLQGDVESKEYKVAYHTLQYMLENALNQYTSSPEIEEIIAQYICEPKDSESDDVSTAHEDFIFDHDEHRYSGSSEQDSDTTFDLTTDNLKQWNENYPKPELAGALPEPLIF